MFFNNTICDIYIGTGAGKKLMAELSAAKRSIKIVSPYLSESLVDRLVHSHARGVEVALITTETTRSIGRNFVCNLLKQEVHVNGKARRIQAAFK